LFALAAAATVATLALARPPTTLAITVPPAPPPAISVGTPIVTVNVPAPPTPPDKPAPTPRMLVPYLDVTCLLPAKDAPADGVASSCDWDDGFPAVSTDGMLVAVKEFVRTPMDGSTTTASIQLRDTRTSRVVEDLPLFTAEDLTGDRASAFVRVTKRVEAARAVLDGRHFVAMLALGDSQNAQPDATQIHAECVGSRARIVDPTAALVLWVGEPGSAPQGRSAEPHDDQAECAGWNLHDTRLWWHPGAKVVFAEMMYFTGGCMCPDEMEYQSWRIH